jgi:anti-sigma factor RsiW
MKHEISELLPFYANGTLDELDRSRVETELATCLACADELRHVEALASALQARAAAAPPPPPSVLDAALARISTPPAAAASTKFRTAWWGVPARYATAAALVVGFSAAGIAAWNSREASVMSQMPQVYKVTRSPDAKVAATGGGGGVRPATVAQANAEAAPPPSVAKQHRLAKKARLQLIVRDVEAALKAAQAEVRSAGGDVTALADANLHGTDTVHGATLEVEIPAGRLDDTLDHLGLLGIVQNRTIDAEDLDAAIVARRTICAR